MGKFTLIPSKNPVLDLPTAPATLLPLPKKKEPKSPPVPSVEPPQALQPPVQSDLDALMGMSPGDMAELPGLFGKLTSEPVLAIVTSVKGGNVAFDLKYYTVDLGKVTLTKNDKGEFQWL